MTYANTNKQSRGFNTLMNKQFSVSFIGATKRKKDSGNVLTFILGILVLLLALIAFLIALPIVGILWLRDKTLGWSAPPTSVTVLEDDWELMVKHGYTKIMQKECFEVQFNSKDEYGYLYLKAEPDIPALNDKIYSGWVFCIEEGVFLQQLDSTEQPISSLIFINTRTRNVECLLKDIPCVDWIIKKDGNEFQLSCATEKEILKYTVQFTSSSDT